MQATCGKLHVTDVSVSLVRDIRRNRCNVDGLDAMVKARKINHLDSDFRIGGSYSGVYGTGTKFDLTVAKGAKGERDAGDFNFSLI